MCLGGSSSAAEFRSFLKSVFAIGSFFAFFSPVSAESSPSVSPDVATYEQRGARILENLSVTRQSVNGHNLARRARDPFRNNKKPVPETIFGRVSSW